MDVARMSTIQRAAAAQSAQRGAGRLRQAQAGRLGQVYRLEFSVQKAVLLRHQRRAGRVRSARGSGSAGRRGESAWQAAAELTIIVLGHLLRVRRPQSAHGARIVHQAARESAAEVVIQLNHLHRCELWKRMRML